jgi:hypothetical protein
MTASGEARIKDAAVKCGSREDLIARLLQGADSAHVAEIGVFRGNLSEYILDWCPKIESYYLVDPWRKLADWNKPFNVGDEKFDKYYQEAMERTAAHKDKTKVLRGRTVEVVDEVDDASLDAIYIDGDHTLRGITIDCVAWWPKLKPGGLIIGDDLTPTIWQHGPRFEPTLVFPFAAYFAEGVGAPIIALPHLQFAIVKPTHGRDYRFVDLTGRYRELALLPQLKPWVVVKLWLKALGRDLFKRASSLGGASGRGRG